MHVMYNVVQDFACKSREIALCIKHGPYTVDARVDPKKKERKKKRGRVGQGRVACNAARVIQFRCFRAE